MNKIINITLFILVIGFSNIIAQDIVYDYTKKTESNSVERLTILNVVRAKLLDDYNQEFTFVVKHLRLSDNFAWFRGNVLRKDGKKVIVEEWEDCCHVEALLKKVQGKWTIFKYEAFSTEVWYEGIWDLYNIPKEIFDDFASEWEKAMDEAIRESKNK